MGHKHDFWETIRSVLLPKLGIVAHHLNTITKKNYYVEADTHKERFVGRVEMGEEEFEKVLHDLGFERNPLAAWKHLETDADNYEEASFRKIGFEDEPRKQLHVVLYDGANVDDSPDEYTYVYAHFEYRWDTNPIKHYRGHEVESKRAVKRMKWMLDGQGIEWDGIRP